MALRRNQDTPCWVGVLDRRGTAVIEERGSRLPFGGYGRSHRRGLCSGGLSGVEEKLG